MKEHKYKRLIELRNKQVILDSQMERITDEIEYIKKDCDHKYPNGESAVESGKGLVICRICQTIKNGVSY